MSSKRKISVISIDPADGKSFIQESCLLPIPADNGSKTVGDCDVQMTLFGTDRLKEATSHSDIAVLIVHFMDLISVEELRGIYRLLEKKAKLSTVIALYRAAKEDSFKMSCFVCGQKIWVPDERAGHRGRCPNCRKEFDILGRRDHVRSVLGLVEGIQVVSVESGVPDTFAKALSTMLGFLEQSSEKRSEDRTKIRIKKKQLKTTFHGTSIS